ncbi:MAG: SPW repeat protein [Alicyclobacillus sp.]|nr:SPW repeat protein [Alicyclobacillus sp.]
MKARNWVAGVIGIWFIVAPWALSFADHTAALWWSIIPGAIQAIVSGWIAMRDGTTGWRTWQNWVALAAGVWFVLLPYVFNLGQAEIWTSVILGAVTILLNLWAMGVPDQKEDVSNSSGSGSKAHA